MRISEVRVGTELEPFVVDGVSAEKMKLMAALLHDPNPIHLDPEAVRGLGMGDRVVNQGPANQAYLVNMLLALRGRPGRRSAASPCASWATSSRATGWSAAAR